MDTENIFFHMGSIARNLERLIDGEPSPSHANVCRVKVYKENLEGTVRRVLFETEIDMMNEETSVCAIAETYDSITRVEIDVYDDVKRHINYLESRVAELDVILEGFLYDECEEDDE